MFLASLDALVTWLEEVDPSTLGFKVGVPFRPLRHPVASYVLDSHCLRLCLHRCRTGRRRRKVGRGSAEERLRRPWMEAGRAARVVALRVGAAQHRTRRAGSLLQA